MSTFLKSSWYTPGVKTPSQRLVGQTLKPSPRSPVAKRQTMAESRKWARDISRSDAGPGLRHQIMDLAQKLIMRDPGKAERLVNATLTQHD